MENASEYWEANKFYLKSGRWVIQMPDPKRSYFRQENMEQQQTTRSLVPPTGQTQWLGPIGPGSVR